MSKLEAATQIYLEHINSIHINSIIENFNSALDEYGEMSEQNATRLFTRSQNLIKKCLKKILRIFKKRNL